VNPIVISNQVLIIFFHRTLAGDDAKKIGVKALPTGFGILGRKEKLGHFF